jgi:hypothetical protein
MCIALFYPPPSFVSDPLFIFIHSLEWRSKVVSNLNSIASALETARHLTESLMLQGPHKTRASDHELEQKIRQSESLLVSLFVMTGKELQRGPMLSSGIQNTIAVFHASLRCHLTDQLSNLVSDYDQIHSFLLMNFNNQRVPLLNASHDDDPMQTSVGQQMRLSNLNILGQLDQGELETSQTARAIQIQESQKIEASMMRERSLMINQMALDSKQIRDIQLGMLGMIEQQGERIDRIDDLVDQVIHQVQKGTVQLERKVDRLSRAMRIKVLLVMFGCIVILLIILSR